MQPQDKSELGFTMGEAASDADATSVEEPAPAEHAGGPGSAL